MYFPQDPFKFKAGKKSKKKGELGKWWYISSAAPCVLCVHEANLSFEDKGMDGDRRKRNKWQEEGGIGQNLLHTKCTQSISLGIHLSSKEARKARRRVNWASGGAYQVQPTCFLLSANGIYVTPTSVR